MWYHDLLWGFWNGLTAWFVLIAHVFGAWDGQPVYDTLRAGNWYDFGFLLGAGSPFLGMFGGTNRQPAERHESRTQAPA
jgi:hypothetical protein